MNNKKLFAEFRTATGLLLLIIAVLSFSCCSTKQSKEKSSNAKQSLKHQEKAFIIQSPKNNERISKGQMVNIELASKQKEQYDSITANIRGKKIELIPTNDDYKFQCNIQNESYGQIPIKLDIYLSDSLHENHLIKVLHLPKEEPKQLTYELIRSFPHDREAYTQGLIYKDGVLYESTGQQRRSSIRAIDPKTGDVIRKKALDPQYFGEGIAIVDNEIYMLTYRAQIGFVFDLVTFDLIKKFNLQTNEGWGLTILNDTILMSDGSANIYFFKPDDYFTLLGQKEICDNLGPITFLNELEYTPHGLYSNVYGKNFIYLIDIHQGIVTHSLDLTELFPENVSHDMDHVLNGIAYNNKTGNFYVTGKQWPVMYEIKITAN